MGEFRALDRLDMVGRDGKIERRLRKSRFGSPCTDQGGEKHEERRCDYRDG